MTVVETTRSVTTGVDTHAEVHVAAVVRGTRLDLRQRDRAQSAYGMLEELGWIAAARHGTSSSTPTNCKRPPTMI